MFAGLLQHEASVSCVVWVEGGVGCRIVKLGGGSHAALDGREGWWLNGRSSILFVLHCWCSSHCRHLLGLREWSNCSSRWKLDFVDCARSASCPLVLLLLLLMDLPLLSYRLDCFNGDPVSLTCSSLNMAHSRLIGSWGCGMKEPAVLRSPHFSRESVTQGWVVLSGSKSRCSTTVSKSMQGLNGNWGWCCLGLTSGACVITFPHISTDRYSYTTTSSRCVWLLHF